MKISRFVILFKNVGKEFHSYIHPRSVKQIQLDEKQAMTVALSRLENEVAAATCSGELLEKRIKARFDGESFILDCTVICLEDIAQVSDISTQ